MMTMATQYHNPKGQPFPLASERHQLTAIYVARYKEGIYNYCRFMDSLRRTRDDFRLFIVYKGFPDIETAYENWHPLASVPTVGTCMMADQGYDLTAYRHGVERVNSPIVVCFNTHTEILNPRWPSIYADALNNPTVGLVGATGSWESFQKGWLRRLLFPPWPNPHVRTNAFAMRRDLLLKVWPRWFHTKQRCYLFESGHNSLTRRVWREGLKPVVVTGSNVYDWWNWRDLNYRSNNFGLIAADNQTRRFHELSPAGQSLLHEITWGI